MRRRRLALDLTQVALARRVGCSASTIKKLERDERRPSRTTAERLAECLEIAEADQATFVATALAERAAHRLPLPSEPVDDAGGLTATPSQADAPIAGGPAGIGHATGPEQLAFVGRGAELDELRRWRRGPPGEVVIVSGEPGVGKTRLVAEFSREVTEACTVLYGRADEGDGSAYEPVLGALRQLVVGAGDDELDAVSATASAALFRLVPEMAERRPEAAAVAAAWGDIDRSWLLGAVAGALADLRHPILFVVDDLQWADRSALLLLERLAGQTNVRVLGTSRDPLGAPGTPLTAFLAQLRRAGLPVRRIELDGLTLDALSDLMAALQGGDLSEDGRGFAVDLHRRTGGNPFFTREMIRHLEDTGAIAPSQRRWLSDRRLSELGVPLGVHEVVGQRLAGLDPTTMEVLGAAAVVGQEFDVDVVAAMLRRDDSDVIGALDAASRASVVREAPQRVDRYEFVHALVREVVLDTISLSRRVRLEWRAGEALQALRMTTIEDHAAAIAQHFAEGVAAGDAGKAARWALRAGEAAVERLAYEEAIDHYERGLRCLDRDAGSAVVDRADLLLALGRATIPAGVPDRRWEACREAAELARASDDPERLAHAAITLLGPLGPGVLDESVVGLLEEAADGLRGSIELPAQRALLAELLARLSGYLTDERPDQAAALRDEALDLARQAGDARTLALALTLSTAGFVLGRDEQQGRLVEAAQLADEAGDVEVALVAHSRLMAGALTWGDREGFDRHLAEYARVATTTQSPLHLLLSATDHAGAAGIDGRYAEALERSRTALREARAFDDPNLAGNIRLGVWPVIRELGRLGDQVPRLREMKDDGPHPPLGHALLAQALCAAGAREEAGQLLAATVEDPAVRGGGELYRMTLALLAEVAAALGDARAAARLMPWLESERSRGDCVIAGPNAYYGALRRYLGLLSLVLAHTDGAAEHHAAALAVHERMRASGWAARSRYDLARALVARGENERAAALAGEAAATAQELGMVTLVEEARAVTGDSG